MHTYANLILLLALIAFAQVVVPSHQVHAQSVPSLKVGIDIGHGNLYVTTVDLSNFTNLLTSSGAQILYNTGALNQTYLASINLFLISSPQTNLTFAEIGNLTNWFNSGGALWISTSGENINSMRIGNSILRAINSQLGFEYGYTSDPLFNLNSTTSDRDQVLTPLINHKQGLPAQLTTGIRTIYAYRPVPIISFNGTKYTKFNYTLYPGTTWIAQTSSNASVTNSSSTPLLAYANARPLPIPVITVEKLLGNRLALTGSPIFSTAMKEFLYRPSQPYDNRLLVKNLLAWLNKLSINGELEASLPEIHGTGAPLVLIYTGSDSRHADQAELQPLTKLLTDMGFNAQTFTRIEFNTMKNASAIILQTPHQLITANESGSINLWMEQGNKLLILASMADYALAGNATESISLNGVLTALHSSLRFEQGSVIDPEVNLGGDPYLTLASNINHESSAVSNLTTNIRSLNMQFGTILAGANQTGFNRLENQTYLNTLTNVTWIARTSSQSQVFNLKSQSPMQAHSQFQRGTYILAAQEKYRSDKYRDTILLFGGPIFSDFSRLLEYPAVYGYPTDNLIFMRNIFGRLFSQTQIRTEIRVNVAPTQLTEGGTVTLYVHYNALQTSTSNISEVDHSPISPANITLTLSGTTLTIKTLPNLTYTATTTPISTGSITWSASASATRYVSQSSSGTVQVNPVPTRFTYYVLGIPIVIFIAVTIAVVARKTR